MIYFKLVPAIITIGATIIMIVLLIKDIRATNKLLIEVRKHNALLMEILAKKSK